MPLMTHGCSLCDGNCGAMGPAVDEVEQQPASNGMPAVTVCGIRTPIMEIAMVQEC
jgi:hypothetical protein